MTKCLENILIWPRQPLTLTYDVQSLYLMHQVILDLVDFEPHLLVLSSEFVELSTVELDVLPLF